MSKSVFGSVCRAYFQILSKLGRFSAGATVLPSNFQDVENNVFDGMTDSAIDDYATHVGDLYRSLGIMVGILGASIVFCAIAPIALSIKSDLGLLLFGIAKVSMMLLMAILVFAGRRNRLKEKWIGFRKEAERRRYSDLRKKIDKLHCMQTEENAKCLFDELRYQLIDSKVGQLHYNQYKASEYKSIELFSVRITWWGFTVALLAAFWLLASELHLIPHNPFLLFFTVFVPTVIGCVHSINGFLNIAGLAEEYEQMARFLESVIEELNTLQMEDSASFDKLVLLAERAYSQLMNRDLQWADKMKTAVLKPA